MRRIITILVHIMVELGIVERLSTLIQIADLGVLAPAQTEVTTGLLVVALTLVLMVFMVGKDGHGLLGNTVSMVDQEALEITNIVPGKMAGAEQEVQAGHTTASMETDATVNMEPTIAASMERHTMKAEAVEAVVQEDLAELITLEQTIQEEVLEAILAPITTAPMVVKEAKMDIPTAAEEEVPQPPKPPTPKMGTALVAKEDTGMSKGDGLRQQPQQPPPLEEDNLAMAMDTQVVDLAAVPALTLKRRSSTMEEAHHTDTLMAVALVQAHLQTRRRPLSTIKEVMRIMITVTVEEQTPTPKPLESLLLITTMKEVMTMVMTEVADRVVPTGLQERSSLIEVVLEKNMGTREVHQTVQPEEPHVL